MAIGPGWMADRVATAFSVLGDRRGAFGVGQVAEAWAVLRARAVETGGDEPVAWTLWDVPLAPLLDAVPEGKRAAAAKALESPLRPQ